MDAKEELALLVHMPNKIVKSRQFYNELYSMDSNDKKSFILTKKQNKILNMLEENLKCLSPRQKKISRALQSDGDSHGGKFESDYSYEYNQ